MSQDKPLDLDCWPFHLGFIEGALRALGASSEVIKSLNWIRDNVFEEQEEKSVDKKFEKLFKDVDAQQKTLKRSKPKDDDEDDEDFYDGKKGVIETPPPPPPAPSAPSAPSADGKLSDDDKARTYYMREVKAIPYDEIFEVLPHVDEKKVRGYIGNARNGQTKKPTDEQLKLAAAWYNSGQLT